MKEDLNKVEKKNRDIDLFSSNIKLNCYFNLFENGRYELNSNSRVDALYSIPIYENSVNGYLLQCYENGCVNKVYISSLLQKQRDYSYSNGKYPNVSLIYCKIIKEDCLIGVKIKRNEDISFKIHRTINITNREHTHLKGYKIVYDKYSKIEYVILPNSIIDGVKRIIFESFTANGKSIYNKYYENEFNIIEKYIPNLYTKNS